MALLKGGKDKYYNVGIWHPTMEKKVDLARPKWGKNIFKFENEFNLQDYGGLV